MQESSLILSEYEEINSLLYKPIIATQRIKYTCIDVSANRIVLGSTSGSLYLFKKEGCLFQQLIPLSEGTVTRVLLSPDEKTVALSTKRGRVCVISLKPTIKLLSVSNEHLGAVVTCLCWNDKATEIYVGDDHGKISTIVLSIFTVNGMFQAPSSALMHLDSSIVQTDYISHYLLVSTLTRCYICDTSEEQFKQIGNKARDGDFGACFFKRTNNPDASKTSQKNQDINSATNGASSTEDENLLIFSARPGCRLWEVKINGIVTKTHQFKEALSLSPIKIYQSSNVKTLNIIQQNEEKNGTQVLNFSRLYVIKKKYLLSFTTTGLYIIDPVNATVILWTDELKNISAAQIIDDKIYIMKTTGTFHCIVLNYVENLILKLYEMKLYSDCLNACMTFRPDLMKLVDDDDNSDDVSNEQSTADVQSKDITSILEPVINVLQINLNNPPKRLNSGIVLVNSGSSTRLTCVKNLNGDQENGGVKNGDEASQNETDDGNLDEIICNGSGKTKIKNKSTENQIISPGQNGDTEKPSELEIATLNIQTDLQPIYELINSLKSSTEIELENIIKTIKDIIKKVNEKYSNISELNSFLYEIIRSIEKNYFYTLLTSTCSNNFELIKSDFIVNEILRGFLDLNLCKSGEKTSLNEPKFLIIGQGLLSRLSDKNDCIDLCKNVPYMWRYYLSICSAKGEDIDDFIDLCLETRDSVVIAILIMMIDERQWKILVDYFEKMEAGGRDDEGENFSQNRGIDWSSVVFEIMRQKGTDCAMTFLTIIESNLPKIKLNNRIFQSMIFNKLLKHHGYDQVVELDRNKYSNKEYNSICSAEARQQLVEALEKDLEHAVDDNLFGNGAHHWGIKYDKKSSTCPCCTLSLHTPVLLGNNGIAIFPCGHAYHANCLVQKKLTRCCLHSQNT